MLPDFTRVAWASPQAQAVWGERVRRISQAWEQIERFSVLDGLRSSALQTIAPEAMPQVSMWAASVGLHVIMLDRVGVNQTYAASHVPHVEGKGWAVRAAIATPRASMLWPDAWVEKNDDLIGRLLGFPLCCRRFFAETWGKGLVDTTWHMLGYDQSDSVTLSKTPKECNILLRWLGVRAVTHLPCSFTCEESVQIGSELISCGRQHGFAQEMDWLEQMLDWPVEWSALHGIAEIVTPVCRIQTRTNYSSERLVIRREGSTYPAEGARGVRFPFNWSQLVPIRRGASEGETKPENDAVTGDYYGGVSGGHSVSIDQREWTDNGFQSKEAMDAAHAKLLAAIGPGPFRCVLDLGCGNGALLSKVPANLRKGVESDASKADRARRRSGYRRGAIGVVVGDCTHRDTLDRVLRYNDSIDLIIAQAHRNPPEMFPGYRVLSYSYDEPSFARLIEVPKEVAV